MKNIYRILTALILLLSITLSASSCAFLNGGSNENDDKSSTADSQTPESNQNEGGESNNEGSGNNGSDNGNNNEDSEGSNPDNEVNNKDEENPPFVPDMSKQNTIETDYLPHLSYSSLDKGSYNTELFYKNSYEVPLGDPSVFVNVENGKTYFYVTGTAVPMGFEMWKTSNFDDWEKLGTIYSPPENFFGVQSFWAPQIIYDANADWQYYLGEESESGKGLYILFFSARKSNNVCALSVAFSKNVAGPYKNFKGTNANGDYIDESSTLFDIEKLKGLNLYKDHVYGDLYKAKRSFIDACPFIDPKTNDKYLYMVRSRNVDTSNDVWGVKMKDWVTPAYDTTTPLTSYGYTDIEKSEAYGYLAASSNKIDEGPFLYYKDGTDDGVENGKYYLTFSIGGTSDKLYPVCQAIGDSPLGPFTKIQPEDMGLLNCPEQHWNIHGCGHHAFFETNGELYVAYHSYKIGSGSSIGSRYFAFDKIEWLYNEKGQYVMRSNGPSTSINPLPSATSGYVNLAKEATVTSNLSTSSVLNDGIIATREGDENMLFSVSDNAEITLSFDEYVSARAIMLYNSYDFNTAFLKIDKIELSYRKEIDGRLYFGVAIIENLGYNFNNNFIPQSYLEAVGETVLYQLHPASSSIAEFEELEINSIKIYIENHNGNSATAFSEIVVLGKHTENTVTDESIGYGGYTLKSLFKSYDAFDGTMPTTEKNPEDSISINGNISESLWTDLATLTVINGATIDSQTKEPVDVSLYGEREAKVYAYVGKRKLYFAFDVKDKNLFFNSSQPQGRSTCIEIYFASANTTTLSDGCYSVRINPTGNSGELSCNLGVYVPNAQKNEWTYCAIGHNVKAVAKVFGSVQTNSGDTEYDSSLNTGYTVEVAIDKILIGLFEDSIRFTAAFVQDRGYDEPRIANTFIPGTHYTKPSTWILLSGKESDSES